MKQAKTPQEKKALSYDKDHRIRAESYAAHFKTYRRVKARAVRKERHKVKVILTETRYSDDDKRGDVAIKPVRRDKVRKYGPVRPLRQAIEIKFQIRIDWMGTRYFLRTYNPDKREAFAAFLASLIEGQSAVSRKIALQVRGYLTPGPCPIDNTLRWQWRENWRTNQQLMAFFADEPEWEPRLRAWVAQMCGDK